LCRAHDSDVWCKVWFETSVFYALLHYPIVFFWWGQARPVERETMIDVEIVEIVENLLSRLSRLSRTYCRVVETCRESKMTKP
jgi:hypothetical protein